MLSIFCIIILINALNFYDGINFSCSNFNFDGGDCQEVCTGEVIPDCFDNCYPLEWIGDSVCDNGYDTPSNFWCEEFNWDEGDCGVSSCGEGLILDADSNCVSIEGLFIQDCNGSNIPISYLDALSNWHCNDGIFTMGYVASNTFNLNCEEFNYDGGDCNDGDAAINPGSSGGALIDSEGRFVGLIDGIFTKDADIDAGVNFAISLSLIRASLADMRLRGVRFDETK